MRIRIDSLEASTSNLRKQLEAMRREKHAAAAVTSQVGSDNGFS